MENYEILMENISREPNPSTFRVEEDLGLINANQFVFEKLNLMN